MPFIFFLSETNGNEHLLLFLIALESDTIFACKRVYVKKQNFFLNENFKI